MISDTWAVSSYLTRCIVNNVLAVHVRRQLNRMSLACRHLIPKILWVRRHQLPLHQTLHWNEVRIREDSTGTKTSTPTYHFWISKWRGDANGSSKELGLDTEDSHTLLRLRTYLGQQAPNGLVREDIKTETPSDLEVFKLLMKIIWRPLKTAQVQWFSIGHAGK